MQRFLHDPVENLRSGGVRERCFHYVSKCFDEFAHRGPIVMSVGGDMRLPVGRVSIRFEVRGGSRPYPLARRPDKPCCGGFTHHPSSPLQQADRTCPKWGKTPSQAPYTPEAVFGRSPTPLPEGVSKMPSRRELGVFVGFYLGPGPVPRRGIRPRARSGLLFGRR